MPLTCHPASWGQGSQSVLCAFDVVARRLMCAPGYLQEVV
jgi:hypothetical protein